MPLEIEDRGIGNRVEMGRAEQAALQGRVVFTGDDAVVAFGPGCLSAPPMYLELGSGASVQVGAAVHLSALFVHASAGTTVVIGDGCGLNGLVRLLLHEPGRITIGAGCLIAADVDITVSDMHPIFDAATGSRINPAADVLLHDRVWVGQRCLVLKGAEVGPDTVLGAGSIVTGVVPGGCVAAGNPARVVRSGVRWSMDL